MLDNLTAALEFLVRTERASSKLALAFKKNWPAPTGFDPPFPSAYRAVVRYFPHVLSLELLDLQLNFGTYNRQILLHVGLGYFCWSLKVSRWSCDWQRLVYNFLDSLAFITILRTFSDFDSVNQFYNTRDPADLYLNVDDYYKSFTCLYYPFELCGFLLFNWG